MTKAYDIVALHLDMDFLYNEIPDKDEALSKIFFYLENEIGLTSGVTEEIVLMWKKAKFITSKDS